MTVLAGDILEERYEVLGVHPGGMGVVYVVRDRESGERFAAKAVKEELRSDPRILRRFEREVRTWIRLGSHRNLVEALFVTEIEGAPHLFLEYVDGPTLASVIRADGPLLISETLDLAIQFGRGLIHAHEAPMRDGAAGLVHRDIKPENLFVTRDRVGKVSDLGIAKVLSADLELTAEGLGVGTPLYVSPEQLKGTRDVDGRADVYSFGAVLYEMVTGVPPLKAESLESQIYMVLRTAPVPPTRHNQAVPDSLCDLILRCLEKKRERRFPGFRALTDALGDLLEDPEVLGSEKQGSTCEGCGYGSPRRPDRCPVCGEAMGAPLPRRARPGAAPAPRPARLSITDTCFSHGSARVGERVTVSVTVVNSGTVPARQCELECVLPDADVFRRSEKTWCGEVPPTRSGKPTSITYEIVPLREGSFSLPEITLTYIDEGGTRRTVAAPGGARLGVSFNYELPLVGKERELRRVLQFFDPRRAGFALLSGEAGSGMSRLLAEIGEKLEGEGWLALRGKSLESSREPMKTLHDVARRIFGVGAAPLSAKSLMARVIDRLDPLVGEDAGMAGFFARLLSGALPTGEQVRMREYLWFRLLSALAEQSPVVLVVADLHWAEEETIDLLESIVLRAREENVPLAVMGTALDRDAAPRTQARISHLRDRFAALARNTGLTCDVVLAPIEREHVAALLDAVFPGSALAEDHPWLVPTLLDQTGGNPFHVIGLLRLLREARDESEKPLVSLEEGAWTLRPAMDEERLREWIPEEAGGMVRALLRPLSPEVLETLETAAVIGEEFDRDLLQALTPDARDLSRDLEVLEQAALIRVRDLEERRFRFPSSLVPLAIERSLGERSRLALARRHREVAQALSATRSPRALRRVAARYAHHLRLGGERDEAFRWTVIAAEDLVGRQLFLRAGAILSRAEKLLEDGAASDEETRGRHRYLRGEVFRVTGKLEDALKAFERAIELLSGTSRRSLLAKAFGKIGKVHEARGEIESAMYSYQLGAQIRKDLGDAPGTAHSLNNLGALHVLNGEEAKALEAFREARRIAEESGDASALGQSLGHLASLEARRGEWERAEELYGESMRRGEETGDRLGVARSLNGLGTVAARRGRLEEALACFSRTLEVRREVGDREGVASVLSNLGVIHDRMGHYDRCLESYRRSAEAHRQIGSRRGLASVLNNLGVVLLLRGDVTRALLRFEEALRIREEIGDRERSGLALMNLGEACGLAGLTERAKECFERAAKAYGAAGDKAGTAGLHAARAEFARRRGDLARAVEEVRSGLSIEGREPGLRARLHLEMTEILQRGEDPLAAASSARHAFDLAVESGDRAVIAHGHRLVARSLACENRVREALGHLASAEESLPPANGPELLRVVLERARLLIEENPGTARLEIDRAGRILESLRARGAVLREGEALRSLAEQAARNRSTS